MSELKTVLLLENVTKTYGTNNAVADVSFSVRTGEVIGFVGLNGAGKSTTINLILGFLRASAGTVRVFGQKIAPETAHKTHSDIGFVAGDMSLFEQYTGRQYLAFVRRQYGTHDAGMYNELIERFDPQLNKKIKQLSRGNKQKIALIAAFMTNPKLVVLDEPTSGLDPVMQQAFLKLVQDVSARGTTVFMSSHYLNEVADVCSRVLLMRGGKLVKDIPSHQLAAIGGKHVRVVTNEAVLPPEGSESVVKTDKSGEYTLEFVSKGTPRELQQWLTHDVHGLHDIEIRDHDLEAAFSSLYKTGENNG